MFRVRLGIILIIVSWLPIAQLVIYAAHNNNQLTSDAAAQTARLVVWGIQIVIGIIGVLLVGKVAIDLAKSGGWKKTPGKVWHLFWHGAD